MTPTRSETIREIAADLNRGARRFEQAQDAAERAVDRLHGLAAQMEQRRVYVAGSTRDITRVNLVQAMVRYVGWKITFDWTGAEGEIRTDGSWDTVPEKGAEIASREVTAASEADLTILLFPPTGGGLGCWIEMGATLAAGGEVWVVEPARDSVFWQHPRVRRFRDIPDLSAELGCGTAAEIAA